MKLPTCVFRPALCLAKYTTVLRDLEVVHSKTCRYGAIWVDTIRTSVATRMHVAYAHVTFAPTILIFLNRSSPAKLLANTVSLLTSEHTHVMSVSKQRILGRLSLHDARPVVKDSRLLIAECLR